MSDAKSIHMFSLTEENRNKLPYDKGIVFTVADNFRALLLAVWLLCISRREQISNYCNYH